MLCFEKVKNLAKLQLNVCNFDSIQFFRDTVAFNKLTCILLVAFTIWRIFFSTPCNPNQNPSRSLNSSRLPLQEILQEWQPTNRVIVQFPFEQWIGRPRSSSSGDCVPPLPEPGKKIKDQKLFFFQNPSLTTSLFWLLSDAVLSVLSTVLAILAFSFSLIFYTFDEEIRFVRRPLGFRIGNSKGKAVVETITNQRLKKRLKIGATPIKINQRNMLRQSFWLSTLQCHGMHSHCYW